MKKLQSLGLSVLAAALLVLAYPQLALWPLAWVGMVPLLLLIEHKTVKSAFGWSFLTGFLFFFGTLGWLIYVTYPGAILLSAYLGLYFALFSVGHKYFAPLPCFPRLLARAALWVSLEYIRSYLFTGFGWALLGHSQYQNLSLIQVADITGVYGISFLVILVNLLIVETIHFVKNNRIGPKQQLVTGWLVVGVLIAGAYFYSTAQLSQKNSWPTVNIGVVQPNIPQDIKWLAHLRENIIDKQVQLTGLLDTSTTNLVVWPETALPGLTWESPELMETIANTAKNKHVPILFGAMTQIDKQYFNSALQFSADGESAGQYDKIHLVPFGEYLPLRPILGWINRYIGLEDFTSGKTYHLFDIASYPKSVGVLICFEDTLSHIRRQLTQSGAKLWINITNDAWFQDTKAPFMHLQVAVFGSVEHKRALVRSANTGFSGFIDPFGRVIDSVKDSQGKKTFIAGVAQANVPLVDRMTFYTKYADIFTYGCFLGILLAVWYVKRLTAHRGHYA